MRHPGTLALLPSVTLFLLASFVVNGACGGDVFSSGQSGSDAGADGASSGDGSTTSNDGAPPLDGGDGGEDHRLRAFVTGVGYADVTNELGADAKCRAEAAGRLPGMFVAWYSTSTIAAPSRLVDSRGRPVDGPWFRVDGARIAASRAALLDTAKAPLENPISLSAAGIQNGGGVWTGTLADGTIGALCPDATTPTTGSAGQVGPAWTDQKFFAAACGKSLSLYCFQVE